jgi:hypothetical protein
MREEIARASKKTADLVASLREHGTASFLRDPVS